MTFKTVISLVFAIFLCACTTISEIRQHSSSFLSKTWALWGGTHFDVQGHRGARGHFPENTLPAFQYALSLGVTTLELDVGLSADNVLVIYHDRSLNPAITRSSDGEFLKGRGPMIRSVDWPTLARFNLSSINPASDYGKLYPQQQVAVGTRMLRLTDLFNYLDNTGYDKVKLNIETKLSPMAAKETASPEEFAQALIAAVQQAKLNQRVSIQSFDWRTLQIVQRVAPDIATVHLSSEQVNFDTIYKNKTEQSPWTAGFDIKQHELSTAKLVKASGGRTWSPNHIDITQDQIKQAKQIGLRVIPWTANRQEDIDRLIDWGVDGLISDYPERVIATLKQRGKKW